MIFIFVLLFSGSLQGIEKVDEDYILLNGNGEEMVQTPLIKIQEKSQTLPLETHIQAVPDIQEKDEEGPLTNLLQSITDKIINGIIFFLINLAEDTTEYPYDIDR